MSKKVTVTIQPDGQVDIDLTGFNGKGCQKTLDDFAAGDKPTLVRSKPEYNEVEKLGVKQHG